MIPIRTGRTNLELLPPEGAGPEVLPMYVERTEAGLASTWELEPEEYALLQADPGHRYGIALEVLGHEQPPIAVSLVRLGDTPEP